MEEHLSTEYLFILLPCVKHICILGIRFENKITYGRVRIAQTYHNLPEDADLLSLTGVTIECWRTVRTVYVRVHLQTVYLIF